MKESDSIQKEMSEDKSDNLFRTASYFRKLERALRNEKFEESVLPVLKDKYNIQKNAKIGGYEINTVEYGLIIFYPKANSLFFKATNNWIKKYALSWIKKRL